MFTHFNILSCWNLSFFQNSFFFIISSNFMIVNERIIFPNFSNKIFSSTCRLGKECLTNMENFFLDIVWSIDIKLSLGHNQQKLLMMGLRSWKSNNFKYGICTSLDFSLKAISWWILNNTEMGMTNPCVN